MWCPVPANTLESQMQRANLVLAWATEQLAALLCKQRHAHLALANIPMIKKIRRLKVVLLGLDPKQRGIESRESDLDNMKPQGLF